MATINDILVIVTRFVFITLGFISLVNYLRHRGAVRRDTMLLFASIAVMIIFQIINGMLNSSLHLLFLLGSMVLMTQPFFMLRIVTHFQHVPKRIQVVSTIGMVISALIIAVYQSEIPTFATLIIVIYFVVIDAYAMLALIRGAWTTVGVVRKRFRFTAAGSGLFGLALLLIGIGVVIPALNFLTQAVTQIAAIGSAVAFYLGLTTPHWLRHIWQFEELRNYQLRIQQEFSIGSNSTYLLTELTQTANRAVGGLVTAVLEPSQMQWQPICTTDRSLVGSFRIEKESVIQEVWENRTSAYISKLSNLSTPDHRVLEATQAQALMLVPIAITESVSAIMLVLLRHGSLFPDDDLEFLELLTQQTAVFLKNFRLTEQLRQQIETRFARVLETTAEAVISIDTTQRIVLFNQSAERIFGYTADEVLGQTLEMLLPPGVAMHHHQFVSDFAQGVDIARGMGERQRELSAKHKTGKIFPIEASISKLTEGDDVILTVFIRDITEQKRAKETQRKIETRFARVLETTAEAVISIDATHRVILFNKSAERIFGYRADEVLGETLEMLLPPGVAQHHQQFIKDFATGHDISRGMGERQRELYAKRKDGTIFPIDASISKLTEGNQVILTVFIRDITAQKQAQEALYESQQRFRSTFEQAAVGIAHASTEGRFLRINQRYSDIVDYPSDELIQLTFQDITHPDDLNADLAYVKKLLNGSIDNYSMEKRYIRKDGSQVWVNLTVSLVQRDDGEPEYFIAVVEDISDRKQIERELRERERTLAMSLSAAGAGVWTWNIEANDVVWDETVESMHGLEAGSFAGSSEGWRKRVHPDDLPAIEQAVKNALAGISPFDTEFRVIWPDGSVHHLHSQSIVITDDNDKPVEMIGIIIDITERKLAEKKLRELNIELEQRVQERTAHLTAVNKELEAFSYSVSHDLRAPLRAVDGFSQALLEDYHDILDDMGKKFLNLIRSESQRMGQLIDDLIALSRFTRTSMNLDFVNLSQIARDIAATLQAQSPDRKVVFKIQSNLVACCDESLMRAMLQNLLGNAWKFTSKTNEAQIEFGWIQQDGKSEYFVRDNGVGFDMAYVDKLFGAFNRLHAVDEFEGTGIGLATVQRIVHRHGGTIRAEAEVDKGASFYFTLEAGGCNG